MEQNGKELMVDFTISWFLSIIVCNVNVRLMQVFYMLVAYITQNLLWQILQLLNTTVSTNAEEPQNGTKFILGFNDQHSGVQRSPMLFQTS